MSNWKGTRKLWYWVTLNPKPETVAHIFFSLLSPLLDASLYNFLLLLLLFLPPEAQSAIDQSRRMETFLCRNAQPTFTFSLTVFQISLKIKSALYIFIWPWKLHGEGKRRGKTKKRNLIFFFFLFSSPKGNWRWERKKRREGEGAIISAFSSAPPLSTFVRACNCFLMQIPPFFFPSSSFPCC